MTRTGALFWAVVLLGGAVAVSAAEDDAEADAVDARYELMVVGVYRPLDLEGRTVVEPREVFLQSVGVPEGPLSNLVGRTLGVVRLTPVPAAMPVVALQPVDAGVADAEPESERPRRRRRRRTTRPAVDASVADVGPSAPEVVVPRTPPMPTTMVETPVGRIEITAVRGEIVVARVVEDGLGTGPTRTGIEAQIMGQPPARVDVPAIMAGDIARYEHPTPPPPPPPPLSDAERARLEAEQQRLEQDDRRRKTRPRPYERPVMRWKL